MAHRRRTSVALLVSVHVDPAAGGRWYARVASYRDPLSPDTHWERLTTVDDVCTAVCGWLESVTQEERAAECVTDQ
jgi:hypothetical protein